ncbi:hypothetical protein [Cellulomonas sp. S1-8]|uniref:hypothetical protein n=1 Tax=Cellulomonas sp. S1-8 TaxID=2904790 RepID=UPI002243C06C|nr:hypothetical protein [Cellulomonas sp. S1-8]UZN03703.1 hypothetical protein OKX07_01795 [Cellulomonas sp. S1-8]
MSHLVAARQHLEAAALQNWSDTARQALTCVGRAEAALASSLVAEPSVAAEREAVRTAAAAVGELVRQAALTIDSLALEPDDDDALQEALLARTGYQDLLDMGTWPQPPLPAFDLAEVDRELAVVVARRRPPVPAGIPAGHTWWQAP